jgi:prepilin-type N-terminal cleavage/methylation domain-containing protein
MSGREGFTLIEVLLSVAIIGMLVGISLPVYESFSRRNDLDVTAQGVVSLLRRAESYSRAVKTDAVWSVEIQTSSATLFQGASFASRNTAYDETVAIPSSITPSGLTEVQFSKFNAAPNTTGTVTLLSNTNDTRVIAINAEGMVSY